MKDLNPKFILGFLSVLTAVGLFFAVFNWFDALKIPFIARGNINSADLNSSLAANSDVANLFALQRQDTDLDGLSDYDELYVYKTSPYIADTDSDGFSDSEEIKNNQDPNCPAGAVCGASSIASATSTAPNLPASADNLTVEQIRSILLQAGISEEELKNVDDNSLRQLYQEVLQESANQNTNSSGLNELQPSDFEEITPAQLRALLIDQGASPEELQDLSDDDLKQLWNQVLSEAQANTNQNQ